MFIGKNRIASTLACCMLPALCSCSDEHGIVPVTHMPDEITFNRTGGTLVIPVDAHGNWDISIEGGNGYKGPEWLADITPDDIGRILREERSGSLPHIIDAEDNDNIFIFWSGHGNPGSFDFGGNRQLSHREMRDYLNATPHRKLLLAVESCYGGGLGEKCEGLRGTLVITAANPYETSHADVWSESVGVYLSNSFTRGFLDTVSADRNVSLRDLYYSTVRTTAGSHVGLYNAACYGSVYRNTMKDFL